MFFFLLRCCLLRLHVLPSTKQKHGLTWRVAAEYGLAEHAVRLKRPLKAEVWDKLCLAARLRLMILAVDKHTHTHTYQSVYVGYAASHTEPGFSKNI